MPTLDWLNRADAFTTAARVPYRLLEPVSVHTAAAQPERPSVRPSLSKGRTTTTCSSRATTWKPSKP